MNIVDRKDFLPDYVKNFSDVDEPLEIAHGQTQSAPHMNGIFLEISSPKKSENALEIGTGSGYLTTLLGMLSSSVISVEIFKDLAGFARKNIDKYHLDNIEIINSNVNKLCLKSKYSVIISAASFSSRPMFLYDKLKEDGRFVYPLGAYPPQQLILFMNGKERKMGYVSFVNIIS